MNPKEKKTSKRSLNSKLLLTNVTKKNGRTRNFTRKAPLTEEEKLAQELEKANEQIEEQKDKYLRLSAEFDNYRKRTMKEKAELILNGGERVSAPSYPLWMTLNAP